MNVEKKYQSYKCNICGNIVEVQEVGGGELVCCGQPMELTTEKLTPVNLMKAFAGESQARNKYEFWGKVAKKEGYEQIAELFQQTADNEQQHAKEEYKKYNLLMGKEKLEDALTGLQMAVDGENYENQIMYPEFAEIADAEGYGEVAEMFRKIAKVETHHAERFQKLKDLVDGKKIFVSETEIIWICRKCGHLHTGTTAPEKCPICSHPTGYFEKLCENY